MVRSKVSCPQLQLILYTSADLDFQAAFEDFLTNYKSTVTAEQLASDALEDLNIDEDGLSDEYDFMDDVINEKEKRRRPGQSTEPRRKYMDMLQKVADREADQVTIELDDLDNVSSLAMAPRAYN